MRARRLLLALGSAATLLASCAGQAVAPTAAPRTAATAPAACQIRDSAEPATAAVVQLTSGGSFTIALRADKAPGTVKNFASIARSGCYDNLTFHRVEPGFVIQGGDPAGSGSGGGTQPTELSDLPFTKGAVGIARANDIRISNRYQFFVCTGQCRHLDNQYTNFGQVSEGQAVADAVKVGDRIRTIAIR